MRSSLVFAAALLGLGASQPALRAQPNDLVGFRLGQSMSEVKKARGSSVRLLQRGRLDRALRDCGMESYAIERGGEVLEITSVRGRIVKLDLSKELDDVDPIAMASAFVAGYGPPRKTACKLGDGKPEVRRLPSECGREETFVELDYWRGESTPRELVALRVRLRAPTEEFPVGHSRVTLSRGWDAQVETLAACADQGLEQLKSSESEGAQGLKPLVLVGKGRFWGDPNLDAGWIVGFDVAIFE